jgi:predicted AAA+ superfamily ATPase
MINRHAMSYLDQWMKSDDRKPLILRGARQVGKTTLVNEFSKKFDVYLSLNLDKAADKNLFETFTDIELLTDTIYRYCKQRKGGGKTLLFIDEIQNSPKAVAMLRYFYEEKKELYVIGAGSLLESLIDTHISFPVGRVEYLAIRPCSFLEFLDGIGEQYDLALVKEFNAEAVHDRIMNFFTIYCIVGGMPAAINSYALKRDVFDTDKVYEMLINAYTDDVQKYARNSSLGQVIRFILKTGWGYAGERIAFERFANSNYRSREIGEAFRTLEKALLVELVYPLHTPQIPMLPSTSKRPKLVWFDTGLVNYLAAVRDQIFSIADVSEVWRGRIAEHVVAQELIAHKWQVSVQRMFWERDKTQSSAEVDFVFPYKNMVIPVEVKSGHNAHLRSLHLFMDMAPHDVAVRLWSGHLSVDSVKTPKGKVFKLINVPFYYAGILPELLNRVL